MIDFRKPFDFERYEVMLVLVGGEFSVGHLLIEKTCRLAQVEPMTRPVASGQTEGGVKKFKGDESIIYVKHVPQSFPFNHCV